MNKKVAAALACCVAASPLAADPAQSNPDAQAVLELERQWVVAEEKRDEGALRRILDDKFLATFNAASKPYDKESFIRGILKADVDPTQSQTLTDETVIVDRDTAIILSTDTLRGTKNGAAYTKVARGTVTYIRRNGRWVALAEHLVMVPPAK
jgi:hypothetical protein